MSWRDKVAYPIPEESGWDVCRWLYRDKKVAFCTTTTWILDSYKDYTEADPNLDFDMVFIPYTIEEITRGKYIIDDTATAITAPTVPFPATAPAVAYDLQGRPLVKTPDRGIYLINGKKYIR